MAKNLRKMCMFRKHVEKTRKNEDMNLKEAILAMFNGKKITHKGWKDWYMYFDGENFRDSSNDLCCIELESGDWEIFSEKFIMTKDDLLKFYNQDFDGQTELYDYIEKYSEENCVE